VEAGMGCFLGGEAAPLVRGQVQLTNA
jgi:hypothetical protein